jgi:hypothetical protein
VWIFLFTIFPVVDAMYCVFLAEISLTMIFYLLDTALRCNFKGIRDILDIDDNKLVNPPDEFPLSLLGEGKNEEQEKEDGIVTAEGEEEIPFELFREAVNTVSIRHGASFPGCQVEEVIKEVQFLQSTAKERHVARTQLTRKRMVCVGIGLLVGVVGLLIAAAQPITYRGPVMYTRHWFSFSSL